MRSVSSQTELQTDDIVSKEDYEKVVKELEALKEKQHQYVLRCAEDEVHKKGLHHALPYDKGDFINNDDKVRFHTGLTNWDTLCRLFEFVSPHDILHSHRFNS